jgi:tRNA(Ile)-lysidine synthase TilS/MesJ
VRCIKCVLPDNYPGIAFNQEGICNYCITYKERKYHGGHILKEEIEYLLNKKRYRNKNYDCLVGVSGGRDSSYLLYYLVKKLNLRVLAYSVDNGFIPEQTKLNMENMCKILNTELIIEEHDYLKKCIKHQLCRNPY